MHWFDLERTRSEFTRILKPGGWCAVIHNNRHLGGDAFHDAYEEFLQEFGSDYFAVKEQQVGTKRLVQFFAPNEMKCTMFANAQELTWEGLEGRTLSSSYIPQPGHPRFEELQRAMKRLYAEHQSDGIVTMRYDCAVCYGRLGRFA